MTDACPTWVAGPSHFFAPRLSNNANYCYLNSVVHVLAQNVYFRRALYDAAISAQDTGVRIAFDAEPSQAPPSPAALSACPLAVMCNTLCEYFTGAASVSPTSTKAPVLTLTAIRLLMRELDASYRAGMMNDAAEALECILAVIDGDATRHRAHTASERQDACIRFTPHNTLREACGATSASLPALGSQLAFSRVQRWSCLTSGCVYASVRGALQHTQHAVYYVRHVTVYPLLYGDQEGQQKTFIHSTLDAPTGSFSELVASRQPEEDAVFVCPGCGERSSAVTTWSAPTAAGVVQLAWHTVMPSAAERKYFLTHVLSETVCLEQLVTWGAASQQQRSPKPWRLTSMVLLRSEHYVALMRDAHTGRWFFGNDNKPILEVGVSWVEAARFIWRASLIPFLLCFTRCDDDNAERVEPLRPTGEFLDTRPPPRAPRTPPPPADPHQRTLDSWMTPQDVVAARHSADVVDVTPMPRKRPRDTMLLDDEDDDVPIPTTDALSPQGTSDTSERRAASGHHIPYKAPRTAALPEGAAPSAASISSSLGTVLDNLSECYPTMPRSVIVEVLSRACGDPTVAADELERRLASGSILSTPRYDPLGLQKIAGSIGNVMERARKSLSSPAAAVASVMARVQPPRAFKPAPVTGLPLIGCTFTVLIAPQGAVKGLQASIVSSGGTVSSRSDRHRVMNAFVLLDVAFMQVLSRRGTLHTARRDVIAMMEDYQDGGLLRTSVIDISTKRLASFSQLKASSEFRIEISEVRALLRESEDRAVVLGHTPTPAAPTAPKGVRILPQSLVQAPISRSNQRLHQLVVPHSREEDAVIVDEDGGVEFHHL
jgi:hypothetical protein